MNFVRELKKIPAALVIVQVVLTEMKKYLLLLFTLFFVPTLAIAAESLNPVAIEKVSYSRATPKGLSAFIPRDGKSLFWGQSSLTYEGKKVWIHLYDVPKTRVQKGIEADDSRFHRLDLFVFSAPKRLKRISSVTFPNADYYGQSFGVRTLWLDLEHHNRPIIEVALQNPHGLYGMITDYAICVFNQGLNKAPVVEQQFGKGDSNAADYSSWNTEYTVTDNGLTGIAFYQGGSGGGRTTFFHWKDDRFQPFRRTQQRDFGDPEPIEVPFDTPLWG